MNWTRVPEMAVNVEGTIITVPEFFASRCFVSIAQFLEFCETTGYQTIAERTNSYRTIRSNPEIKEYATVGQDLRDVPANYVTLYDAKQFADYARCQVISEKQYLSARYQSMSPEKRAAIGIQTGGTEIDIFWNGACMCVSHDKPIYWWGPFVRIDRDGSKLVDKNNGPLDDNWFSVDISFAVSRTEPPG